MLMKQQKQLSTSRKSGSGPRLIAHLGLALLATGLFSITVLAQAPASTAPASAPVPDKPAQASSTQPDDKAAAKLPEPAELTAQDKAALDAMTPKQRELAEDTAKLLQLAKELKVDMDKSSKEMLSLAVVKKADQIERLARKVREEMRVNLGITPGN